MLTPLRYIKNCTKGHPDLCKQVRNGKNLRNKNHRNESGKKNHQNGLLITMPSSICRRDSSWVTSGI